MLEGMILKPNMAISGLACTTQASVSEVAEATVSCLLRVVPAAVPGIALPSGGAVRRTRLRAAQRNKSQIQGVREDTALGAGLFLRPRDPATGAGNLAGKEANREAAQRALLHRARCNVAARRGEYVASMETIAA